jgi:hypothetical protein
MDFWFWFFGIVGVIAFIMAIQPFTQIIWGRPRLEIIFDEFEGRLFCLLQNVPIRGRLLISLCVTRMPIQDLSAQFSIFRENAVLPLNLGVDYRVLQFGDIRSSHMTLPASITCAWLNITEMGKNKKVFISIDENSMNRKRAYLDAGKYKIVVHTFIDGKQIFKEKEFIISNAYPYAHWIGNNNDF